MSVNRNFIDNQLKHRAYDIAFNTVRTWPASRSNNDFAGFDWTNGTIDWEIVDNGIEFRFGGNGARISFLNIRPSKIKSISFGEAQRRNERADNSNSVNLYNYGSNEIVRDYTVSKSNEVSTASSETIGVSVTTSLSQSVSYGSAAYGVEGETSFSLEVQTAWERTVDKSSTSSSSVEDSMEVTIPANKRVEITTNSSIADILQPLTVVAEVDFDIRIQDVHDYDMTFKSIGEFEKFISGLYPRNWKQDRGGSGAYRAGDWYADGNHVNWRLNRSGLKTTITKNIEYQGATTGDVIVREFDL